ncbi:MAG: GNAT family N-acetyltransferase [Bacteroidetes bacterium]|nr:GNAT family N-acetyltransferase [Bacteroidota bacterium]
MNFRLTNYQSQRLLLKEISTSDFSSWLPFFEDPETSKHWVEEKETPRIACEKWYARQFERYEKGLGGMNALIEKSSGKLVGHAGLLVQQVDGAAELEIAYSLLPEFWGKGYAIEAAQKCKNIAFKDYQVPSLISIISLTNLPSQKVATKNGMRIDKRTIYKQNEVLIFRITRAEYDLQTLA